MNSITQLLTLQPVVWTNYLSSMWFFISQSANYLIWALQIIQLFSCPQKLFKRCSIVTIVVSARRLNKVNRRSGKLTQRKRVTVTYTYGQYSRMWIEWRMLTLLQFQLFGLSSNRGRYNVSDDQLNATLSVYSRRSHKFKPSLLVGSTNRATAVTKQLYSFLTWLQKDKIQYSAFNSHIHSFDNKQQNFVTILNTLLFLDVKKPLRNFPAHNYLEIIASLSKFALNTQTFQYDAPSTKSLRPWPRNKFLQTNLVRISTLMRIPIGDRIFFTKKCLARERLSSTIKRLKLTDTFRSRKPRPYQFTYSTGVELYTRTRPFSYLRFVKSLKSTFNVILAWSRTELVLSSRSKKYKMKMLASHNYETRLKSLLRSKVRLDAFSFNNLLTTSHLVTYRLVYRKSLPRLLSQIDNSKTNKVLRCLQYRISLLPHLGSLCSQLSILPSVSIVPKYSLRFKRSLFFFLLLLRETRWAKTDWLSSVYKYSPFYSFTLFPSASNFKVSIFKRLNLQKFLLMSQLNVYSHRSYKFLNVPVLSVQRYSNTKSIPLLYRSLRANFSSTQDRLDTRYADTHLSGTFKYIHVRRLKFKPGYSRLWRESRSDIQEILEMRIKYQNRLTLRLHQLYRQQGTNLFTRSTVTVFFSLLGSQFSMDMWSTLELLKSELIYVNGKVCTNLYLHLFLHDLVQVIINIKFYFLTRFLQNRVFLISSRINKIFYRKYRVRHFNTTSRVRKTLPWTFLHLQGAYTDVLPYLEVDYFTLSSFVILDQRITKVWLPIRAYALELNIINMYNWKYIT